MTSSQIHCFHVVSAIEVSEDRAGAILASMQVSDSALSDAVQLISSIESWQPLDVGLSE